MPPSSCPSNSNHHNQQQPQQQPQDHKSSSPSGGGEGETTKPRSSASSWFSSWFENDPQQVKKQIHDTLNDFEAYQERYERHNPFFFPPQVPTGSNSPSTGTTLQREMEEFLETAGLGGFFAPDPHQWTSSTSSSSSSMSRFGTTNLTNQNGTMSTAYQILRQENPKGVQLEVQFPSTIDPEQVTVQVVEDTPSASCIVQWQHAPAATGTSSTSATTGTFRDQARFGSHVDCSQLSASLSMSQKRLVVQAPTKSTTTTTTSSSNCKPRRIHVTEQGGDE